jgi:hypothetical protein
MSDRDRLSQALNLMQEALQLLDKAKAPAHVGAHLDLAICRLQEVALRAEFTAEGAFVARS